MRFTAEIPTSGGIYIHRGGPEDKEPQLLEVKFWEQAQEPYLVGIPYGKAQPVWPVEDYLGEFLGPLPPPEQWLKLLASMADAQPSAVDFLKEMEAHLKDGLDPYGPMTDATEPLTLSPRRAQMVHLLIDQLRAEAYKYPELAVFGLQLDMLFDVSQE